MQLDRIYHQPCGTLVEIPDNCVDCVVTSPPFNISKKRAQKGKAHNMIGYGESCNDNLPYELYFSQQIELLNNCLRVLKPGGSLFYNHKPRAVDGVQVDPHKWVLQSKAIHYQTIFWDRVSTHNFEPTRLWPIVEYIFHLYKPGEKPRVNPGCSKWTNIWRMDWTETRKNAHPAPFPCDLVDRCLKLAQVPVGGIVLDPYMGSGTTAVQAVVEGIHYIGYEVNPEYIRIAKNRLVAARMERGLWPDRQN